jgi:hypothetical protein
MKMPMIDNLHKETNQRKYSRSLGPIASDCPVLLIKNGRHRKVVSLRRVADPFFAEFMPRF